MTTEAGDAITSVTWPWMPRPAGAPVSAWCSWREGRASPASFEKPAARFIQALSDLPGFL
jgi:hypothetical protein